MIFEHTYLNQDILHEAFIDDNADVSIRDDELTKICDDIYQTLMGAFVAKMMEIA